MVWPDTGQDIVTLDLEPSKRPTRPNNPFRLTDIPVKGQAITIQKSDKNERNPKIQRHRTRLDSNPYANSHKPSRSKPASAPPSTPNKITITALTAPTFHTENLRTYGASMRAPVLGHRLGRMPLVIHAALMLDKHGQLGEGYETAEPPSTPHRR